MRKKKNENTQKIETQIILTICEIIKKRKFPSMMIVKQKA